MNLQDGSLRAKGARGRGRPMKRWTEKVKDLVEKTGLSFQASVRRERNNVLEMIVYVENNELSISGPLGHEEVLKRAVDTVK